jgi:hypothetical protein
MNAGVVRFPDGWWVLAYAVLPDGTYITDLRWHWR